jgi:hypothetical protein
MKIFLSYVYFITSRLPESLSGSFGRCAAEHEHVRSHLRRGLYQMLLARQRRQHQQKDLHVTLGSEYPVQDVGRYYE